MALLPGIPLRPETSVRLPTESVCHQIPRQFRAYTEVAGVCLCVWSEVFVQSLATFHEQQQKWLDLRRSWVFFGYIKCGHWAHSLSQALIREGLY